MNNAVTPAVQSRVKNSVLRLTPFCRENRKFSVKELRPTIKIKIAEDEVIPDMITLCSSVVAPVDVEAIRVITE